MIRIKTVFFVFLSGLSAIACSSNESSDEIEYLSVDSLERLISLSLEEVRTLYPESHIEGTFLQDEGLSIPASRFTINGSSFLILTESEVVSAVIIDSPTFSTDKGIKIGDPLHRVMSSYPDATFYGDFALHELLTVHVKSGIIRFTFDTRDVDLENIILSGEGLSVENNQVMKAPVSKIFVGPSSDVTQK